MTTDANKHAENIRRIARQNKIKGGLASAPERDPIPGTVTPFIEAAFAPASTGGSSGDGTGGDTTTNGSTTEDNTVPYDPADPNTWNRGGGSSTSSETSTSTGMQDVESVIDGEAGSQTAKDDSVSDTGTYTSGGSLDGLTGLTDCDSGQGINIRFDGNFVPPDGWDDPDTPAAVTDWIQGYHWIFTSGGTYTYTQDPVEAKSIAVPIIDQQAADALSLWQAGSPPNSYIYWQTTIITDTDTGYAVRIYGDTGASGWIDLGTYSASQNACTVDVSTACPSSAPTATQWPTDGDYDLALIDGTFQTNPYDSEAPTSAQEPRSTIPFCFGSGRTGEITVTANGGTMIYETSGGAPTGTVKVYASDGTFQAAGDATSSFMNQYLPQ